MSLLKSRIFYYISHLIFFYGLFHWKGVMATKAGVLGIFFSVCSFELRNLFQGKLPKRTFAIFSFSLIVFSFLGNVCLVFFLSLQNPTNEFWFGFLFAYFSNLVIYGCVSHFGLQTKSSKHE